ncbi:MAG: hypothetical protein KDJ70_15875 [Candidatus Competibacteraceae bacterium]|nr:hypothetical protein [Candidatus Competibacteraceae bacterium]
MASIIDLYTADGELVHYRPLSARIQQFLEQYGPSQGYAVTTGMVDTLSLKPGLMRLYEAAIQAGRKPEELGLPALGLAGETGVCRAVLTDAHGRVVATATAAKRIQAYKDLEILETAARQRLLAALGYGGDVLDEDEHQDQRDQGLTPASDPDVVPEGGATGYSADPAPPASAASLEDAHSAAPARMASAKPPGASEADPALAMLNRQIQHQAGLRGLTVAPTASVAEARAALKQLLEAAA